MRCLVLEIFRRDIAASEMPQVFSDSTNISEFGPEAELILLCAGLELGGVQRDRVGNLLRTDVDWGNVLQLASKHGLLPLLFRHVQASVPGTAPKVVYAELWGKQEIRKRRNQAMAEELLAVLRVFESHGIAAVPYKGPALAESVYGDCSLREFADLDVLLSPSDVLKAKRILEGRGYISRYLVPADEESDFVKAARQYDFEMFDETKQISLELHWRTDSEFPVASTDDPGWWLRLDSLRLGDDTVRSIPPHELLLILCLHGIKHHWCRLGWLVDVSELIRQNSGLDWAWVLATAKSMACERRLAISLSMAQSLLGAPVPEDVMRALPHDSRTIRLSRHLQHRLFDLSRADMTQVQALRLDLQLYDNALQKARRITTLVFEPNSADWSKGSRLGPFRLLYAPVRWGRLFAKHVFKPLGKNGS
jgi:hypothetical protein